MIRRVLARVLALLAICPRCSGPTGTRGGLCIVCRLDQQLDRETP